MKQYKILFADMDGTLIETLSGATFPKGIWDMKFKFDVFDKIKELNPDYFFIVTNQGGIGKFVSAEDFESKLFYVCNSIKEYCSIKNVDCTYCSSIDKTDPYRKPNIGMFRNSVERYGLLAFAHTTDMLMIGDASGKPGDFSDSDKKFAENCGIDYLDVNDFVNIKLKKDGT